MVGFDVADHLGCDLVFLDGFGQFLLCAGSGLLSSELGPAPVRKATRLISSEIPCRISSANPIGITRRTGQRTSPPGFWDISPEFHALVNTGQDR